MSINTNSNNKQEKYLQIFKYLEAFSKIRSKTVRNIETSKNYEEIIWFDQIPEHESIKNIIRLDNNDDEDVFLKVQKPIKPLEPSVKGIPAQLKSWVSIRKVEDDVIIALKSKIKVGGQIESLDSQSHIKQKFDDFVRSEWREIKLAYFQAYRVYEKELLEFETLNDFYTKLFKVNNKIKQFGEEFELVIAYGLLNYQADANTPRIQRHFFTQRVGIEFHVRNKTYIEVKLNRVERIKIETEAIIDLEDQFDQSNIIEAEKAFSAYLEEKDISSIFEDLNNGIEQFVDKFSPIGEYKKTNEVPEKIYNKPKVVASPALILRKRNSQNFTALYKNIIQDLEDDSSIELDALDDLVLGGQNQTQGNALSNVDVNKIYFPKPYNNEQVEIARKSFYSNKILVQGPPGTGKSHTIANLMCHLLAKGNKVLVTAYTKRALEVLKDKLPEEFQNLVVNFLGGDSDSLKDLKSSVEAINDRLTNGNVKEYEKEITKLEGEYDEIQRSIASKTSDLLTIKEKNTRVVQFNNQYQGTLIELAREIEEQKAQYEWYLDTYSNVEDSDFFNKLKEYVELVSETNGLKENTTLLPLPIKSKLMSIDDFNAFKELSERADIEEINTDALEFNIKDYEQILDKLKELSRFQIKVQRNDCLVADQIKRELDNGKVVRWNQKIKQSRELIENLEARSLKNHSSNYEISYPNGVSLIKLKSDAFILRSHILNGNPLQGPKFILKKLFYPQEIKERLYFIDAVLVNGSPCDTKEEFDVVLDDLAIKEAFKELNELWDVDFGSTKSYIKLYNSFKELQGSAEQLISDCVDLLEMRDSVERNSSLKIETYESAILTEIINTVELAELRSKYIKLEESFEEMMDHLRDGTYHEEVNVLVSAIDQLDRHAYRDSLSRIEKLGGLQWKLNTKKDLEAKLSKLIPHSIGLVKEFKIRVEDLSDFKLAVYFKHAEKKLFSLVEGHAEQNLIQSIEELELESKNVIAKIASNKAWHTILDQLSGNVSVRQHLQAWSMAVSKIGKTGRGKKAAKYKKIAQREMEQCKDAIPCWIMPLYKIAETVIPKPEMYDYIIIDEASQLGPDAIFLFYISKNIIIVGDDKQTSPEYVGVSSETMTPHIERHLKGIPFADYYNTDFSFFDHAKLICSGQITVLREHFRCMPEIIDFSNKHFYAPEGIPLYPLRQYAANRLEPLLNEYCEEGYIEGSGSKIINLPEAERIAERVKKLVKDPDYEGKSIGVIGLQGTAQSNLISDLILNEIGEKEYFKRNIVCGNSASFQGDERDVMILSLVTAKNHKRASFVKPADERRFNVALSRAKDQVILFHSVLIDDLSNPNDLRYKLLEHFLNKESIALPISIPIKKTMGSQPKPFDSWFEVEVFNAIVQRGISVIPQYEVAKGKYRIDLVPVLPNGVKIAIECDGEKWHGPEKYQEDLTRQKILERCGWQFIRIRGYEFYSNRQLALEPLWELIEMNKLHSPWPEENIVKEDVDYSNSIIDNVLDIKNANIEIEEEFEASELDSEEISITEVDESIEEFVYEEVDLEKEDEEVDTTTEGHVNYNDLVTLLYLDTGNKITVRILKSLNVPFRYNGRVMELSMDSPIAKAIFKKQKEDVIQLNYIKKDVQIIGLQKYE